MSLGKFAVYTGLAESLKSDKVLGDIMKSGAQPYPLKGGLQVTPYLVLDW